MRVQLVGPMTGIEDFNRPAFNEWARKLRQLGYTVFNPAELPPGKDWAWYMRRCIASLMHAECVGLLPGHRSSTGACKELSECEYFSIPVRPVHELCQVMIDSKAGLPFEG